MLPLVATLNVFKTMLDSNSMVLKDKEQVIEVGDYLAEWLVTMAMLVYNNMPIVAALYDAILYHEEGRQRRSRKTMLLDLPMGLPPESHLPSLLSSTGTSIYTLLH